ncbi:MAG: flagellar hook-associated protein FlgL [Kineosporiaceae bacterium]
MRITQQSLASRTYDNLQASLARSARLQEQLSSGKQISRPSDGPGQTASAMQLRGSLRTTEQYVRNADDAQAWLSTADSALQAVSTSLQRARDLAVQGANAGAMPLQARQAIADEVRQIRETVLGLANTQYLGRPVFGGTTAGGSAYDAAGAYLGDTGTVSRRVGPNAQVRADVSGVAVFGDGAGSVFDVLDTLATDLVTDPAAVQASLAAIDGALEDVLSGLSDVGSRVNRVEAMKRTNEAQVVEVRSNLSEVEDIDLPRTIMDLQLQEVAYQAALGATARVLQPSLLDFLR